MICGTVFLDPEMAAVVPRSGLKPGAALLCAAAFCSCTFPGKAGGVSVFCIKTPVIRGGLCEATHICARYVGQTCVHFLMKTKLDSVFFLQPGREKNTKFACRLRKDRPSGQPPKGMRARVRCVRFTMCLRSVTASFID